MRICILDITCPKPYDSHTLQTEPMGGTEATVVRVAEGLAARGHEVTVAQHCREAPSAWSGPVVYCGFDSLEGSRPDAVICLRTSTLIPFAKEKWPSAKLFLWSHDFNQQEYVRDYPILKGSGVKILGVSRHHKNAITDAFLSQIGIVEGLTTSFVYNPIADDLQPDTATVTDPNKLVFFSSPHKGLSHAIALLDRIRSIDPAYYLTVANPGYVPSGIAETHGILNVGTLPHHKVMQEVRSAFCVFHPNPVFAETFGLVHAEALALGVPVLTGPYGANREVIGDSRCIIDVRDEKAVIDRLLLWKQQGRPEVKANPEFRLSAVLKRWEALLNE